MYGIYANIGVLPYMACMDPMGYIQCGAPPVKSGFISPLTIDISPINHSYWTYKPT